MADSAPTSTTHRLSSISMATADQTHRDPLQTVYHRHPCKRMVHTSVSIYSARPTPHPKSNQVDKYVGDLSLQFLGKTESQCF